MILTRQLDRIELDRLYDRAAKRLGDAFDPTMIGIRDGCTSVVLKRKKDSTQEEDYELQGVATTGSVDQDEEVVVPDGGDWSLMVGDKARYKSIYTDHWYGTPSVVATVRWVKRTVSPNGWEIRAKMMPDDYGEPVKQARMLLERGAAGLSIGFMALDRGAPTPEEKAKYPGARSIVRKWKVFEVSVTPMPCNLDCGATILRGDSGKAAEAAELVSKGLAPEWVAKRFTKPIRRVIVCGV